MNTGQFFTGNKQILTSDTEKYLKTTKIMKAATKEAMESQIISGNFDLDSKRLSGIKELVKEYQK